MTVNSVNLKARLKASDSIGQAPSAHSPGGLPDFELVLLIADFFFSVFPVWKVHFSLVRRKDHFSAERATSQMRMLGGS